MSGFKKYFDMKLNENDEKDLVFQDLDMYYNKGKIKIDHDIRSFLRSISQNFLNSKTNGIGLTQVKILRQYEKLIPFAKEWAENKNKKDNTEFNIGEIK